MSYWMKYFNDGTKEKGTDADIASRKASWSQGRLEGINSAILEFAGTVVRVYGSDIWQKDQFVASMNLPGRRVARSVGVRITSKDVGKRVYLEHEGRQVYSLCLTSKKVDGNAIIIGKQQVGLWVVAKISRVGTIGLLLEEKYRV